MGIDPSGYGTIDDYVYQQTMKGKSTTPKTTTSTSNFYMDYYTSDNRGATPFPTAAELKGQWYKDYYTSGNNKVNPFANKNGEVLVKNPYPYGPKFVTEEVLRCLADLDKAYIEKYEGDMTPDEVIGE